MARKKTPVIEIDGPLFDVDVIKDVKDALAAGMAELGDEGAGVMMGFIAAGGFQKTGAFLSSVTSEIHRTDKMSAGWVKVYPTDVWPDTDRPTRTWMETGRRGGVSMTKGAYAFRNTAKRLNAAKFDGYFDGVSEALNGA